MFLSLLYKAHLIGKKKKAALVLFYLIIKVQREESKFRRKQLLPVSVLNDY